MPTLLSKMCQDRTETNRQGEIKLAANLTAVQEVRKRQKLSPEDIIYALEMTIACAISYWITTSGLTAFVDKSSDFLTTAVVMVVAAMSPHDAWQQPLLRVVDTVVGIAVGIACRWIGSFLFVRKPAR